MQFRALEDVVAIVLLAVATLLSLLGFSSFLEMKEIKELVHRYAPKLLATKNDEELLHVMAKEFVDNARASLQLRPRFPGVKDGNIVHVIDPNWQPPSESQYLVTLHQGTDFSVLKGPKELMPQVTGDLAIPPPPGHEPRRHYWFGKQRYEIAGYGIIAIIAFAIFYNTLLPVLWGYYNLNPYNFNNPYNPSQGFPFYLIILAFIGIVCMIGFFIASHMFGWEALDALVGHVRGRLILPKKNGPNYVMQAKILKLLDEGSSNAQIAKRLNKSHQNITNQTKRLLEKKLVERIEGSPFPKYRATERGKRILEKVFGGAG